MDIKKYIASGILEQYVLGLLSEKDRQEVEQYIRKYPEIREEVDSIEKAMELYAESSKMKPSAGLEEKILHEIENTPRDIKTKKPSFNWLKYLLGLLLLTAIILCLYFYNQYRKYQNDLNLQTTAYEQYQEACDEKEEVIQELSDQLDILLNPDNRPYQLNEPGGSKPLAAVLYNTVDRKSYINTQDLPSPPSDRDYQLWALVDGQPVDMGVVKIEIDGDTALIEVPFIENAGVFAITLETAGGNPSPNLDALFAISS